MRSLLSDVPYALRRLLRSPGFTATAVLTLALGIGANTVVYSVVQAVLLNSFPWPDASRLYVLSGQDRNGQEFSVSWPDYVDLRAQQHSFTDMAADTLEHFEYFDGEHATLPRGLRTTASFFNTVGVQPSMGRAFTAQEDSPGGAPVIVLGHKFWQNQLHGNPAAVGTSLVLSGKPYTVVGIMPPGFQFIFGHPEDFYVPMGPMAADPKFNNHQAHGSIRPLARLRPGVSATAAEAEMRAIAARLEQEYPASEKGHSLAMEQLTAAYYEQSRSTLWLLSMAVGLILLVACANVSNLLIARGAERSREYAIRSAIGAGAWRIFSMSLAESLCLALAGGACAVLLAKLTLPLLLHLAPTDIPRLNQTAVSWPVLAFTFGISAAVAILCGALPALAGMKIGPEQALKTSNLLASGGRGRNRLRSALLIAGVALTVALTAGAGLLVRSL
ncbi:MAG: ABC transporter permease, partial [Acidobacteriaceae bacterium]